MSIDLESYDGQELVRFDADDRAALREASELLLEEVGGEHGAWLAGRLAGLAARPSAELGSHN